MRSGRPGPVLIDLPVDVQMAEIEFDIDTYEPLPAYKPAATPRADREGADDAERGRAAADRRRRRHHQRRCVDAAGRVRRDHRRAGHPDADGLGRDPGRSSADGRHGRPADQPPLRQRHHAASPTSCSASAIAGPTGTPARSSVYTKGRKFVHVDIEPTQIGRVFNPDFGIVSDAKAALELFVEVATEWKAAGRLKDRGAWAERVRAAQAHMLRRTHFDNVPIKPQRVYEEMNQAFGRDTCYVTHDRPVADRRRPVPARLQAAPLDQLRSGRAAWAGPCRRRSACAPPTPSREIVALSGDYDFQFMIEELAVGAQFKLPYLHVVVNNSYLGLIRQSQRGFQMDFEVSLAFDNINSAGGRRLRRRPCRGRRRPRLQGDPGQEPERDQGGVRHGRGADGGVPGAGGGRDHPGAGDQHRHGHRDRQRQRVRGNPVPRPVARDRRRLGLGAADSSAGAEPKRPTARRGDASCRSSAPI